MDGAGGERGNKDDRKEEKERKAAIDNVKLDFFGTDVKASDLLTIVRQMGMLEKRVEGLQVRFVL